MAIFYTSIGFELFGFNLNEDFDLTVSENFQDGLNVTLDSTDLPGLTSPFSASDVLTFWSGTGPDVGSGAFGISVYGENFVLDANGNAVSGTVTGLVFRDSRNPAVGDQFTYFVGVSVSLVSFQAAVATPSNSADDITILREFMAGDDTLAGSAFFDWLIAGDGNDVLSANGGGDYLFGEAGNDTLYGGAGEDLLNGGAGADQLVSNVVGQDVASYQESSGAVLVDLQNMALNTGDAAGDVFVGIDDVFGADAGSDLRGNSAVNVLRGALEADTISGRGGDDLLQASGGNDLVFGGEGNDRLNGGPGADNLWGGNGADEHDGATDVFGGYDPNIDYARYDDANYGNLMIRLDGGANSGAAAVGDTYIGIEGLVGGAGNDTVVGNGSYNYLFGSGGADQIFGGAGNDYLSGDTGGDNLWGGAGADAHNGGSGAGVDYARYDEANHGNLVISLLTPATNTGAAAGDTYSGIEGLVGGAGNDTVTGDGLANFLFGSAGADQVSGGAGNDYLDGGNGADNLWGGAGADQHIGGSGTGVDYARYDEANHGNLTIRLDAPSFNAGAAAVGDTYAGIEGLVGGAGNDVIIGNGLNNFLFGSGGADYIDGQAGNDYLNGGAGADRFRLSTALGSTNIDTIADFQVGVDDILLAQAIFAAIGPSLTADEFRIGMAQDSNDYLLYNPGTGQLFYDSNGNVAGGMTHFATVTANTALTVNDFVMV